MAFGTLLKPVLASLAPAVFLYRGVPGSASGVALTFDDGPHPRHTEMLLEILDRERAKGAFFLQGKEVEKYPALVRAIHTAGHELGNHAYSHRRPSDLGAVAYIDEVMRTQSLLEDTIGAPIASLFRPPYGTMSVRTFFSLARNGFRIVHWSVDSGDSFMHDADELAGRIESMSIRAGDILLFHEDQAHTVKAMPAILRALKARSLDFTSIKALWRD